MSSATAVRTALGAFGLTLVGASPPFVLGAIAPFLLAELEMAPEQFGVGVAAFFAASALCSFGGGAVALRFGPRRSMALAAALGIAAMVSVGTWVSSFPALVAMLALAGASNGLGQPASNTAIAANVPLRRRALAMGIKQGAIPLGGALSGLSVPIIAMPFGWRWSVLLVVVVGAALVVATPRIAALPTRPMGARPGRMPDRFRWLLAVAVVGLLGAAGATALGAFLVTALVAENGYPPSDAALLVMAGSVAAFGIRIVLGMVVDRFSVSPFLLIGGLLALSSACFLALGTGSTAVVLALAAVLGLLATSGWQGLFQFGVVQQDPIDPARATGVTQSGMFFGAFAGPLVFGLVASSVGFGPSWLGLAVTSGIGTLTVFAVALHARRRRSEPDTFPDLARADIRA